MSSAMAVTCPSCQSADVEGEAALGMPALGGYLAAALHARYVASRNDAASPSTQTA